MENKKRLTTCDYEFTINYKNLDPVNDKEKDKICVPFKILSLDIEASSSHGDFPLARKNYLKLVTNIIDYLINNNIDNCDYDLLKNYVDLKEKYHKLEQRLTACEKENKFDSYFFNIFTFHCILPAHIFKEKLICF